MPVLRPGGRLLDAWPWVEGGNHPRRLPRGYIYHVAADAIATIADCGNFAAHATTLTAKPLRYKTHRADWCLPYGSASAPTCAHSNRTAANGPAIVNILPNVTQIYFQSSGKATGVYSAALLPN